MVTGFIGFFLYKPYESSRKKKKLEPVVYEDESVTLCSRVCSELRCVHSHDKITLGKDVRDGLINIEKNCKEKIELEILKKRW